MAIFLGRWKTWNRRQGTTGRNKYPLYLYWHLGESDTDAITAQKYHNSVNGNVGLQSVIQGRRGAEK